MPQFINIRFKKRKGFGLDALIMIISTIAIVAILIGVGKVFMTTLEGSYVPLTTDMPKFSSSFDYATNSNPLSKDTSSLLSVYNMLRSGIVYALAALLMVAGILFMLEQIEVVPASTAYGILSKGVLYFIILFAFPPIWDLYATSIELGSKAILDPHNTGQIPNSVKTVFEAINGMGISKDKTPAMTQAELTNIVQFITGDSVANLISDNVKALILGAIGSLMSLMLSFLTYMFSAIRQVLTAVLIAGLPVILILSLVPWFQGITKRLLDTLFGISIVPIFSSLVIVTGAAYLGGITTHPTEEQWFASVAVLSLATFIPTILVPLLGSLFSSITSMASMATAAGGIMAGGAAQAGRGIGSGAYGGAMSAQQSAAEGGQSISGLDLVKGGLGGGLAGGFGGSIHGVSQVGAHLLKHAGSKHLANELQNEGSQIADKFLDIAHEHGRNIGKKTIDKSD